MGSLMVNVLEHGDRLSVSAGLRIEVFWRRGSAQKKLKTCVCTDSDLKGTHCPGGRGGVHGAFIQSEIHH